MCMLYFKKRQVFDDPQSLEQTGPKTST